MAKKNSCCTKSDGALLYTLFNLDKEILMNAVRDVGLHISVKKCFFAQSETLTRPINTGNLNNGPMTAAKASPELIPNTPTATAIASSKLLLAAVKDRVVVSG